LGVWAGFLGEMLWGYYGRIYVVVKVVYKAGVEV